MDIKVKRIFKGDKHTIGNLYINDKFVCDTIEDTDRGLKQDMDNNEISKLKIQDQTAIPTGKYKVTLDIQSPSFSKKPYYLNFCNGYLPRLENVPGFSGILIHRGVDQNHSSGCIIVGYNTIKGKVTNSQKAFETVYSMLKEADDNEENIYITIE